MENPSKFIIDPRIDKPCGNTLREKLHDPVRLRYINWGAKEHQQAFLAPLPGIGNSNPRAIYLVFWTNVEFWRLMFLGDLFVQAIDVKYAQKENRAIGSSSSPKCYCCNEFLSKIREVPWENNRLVWSSIKSTFQRIKNHEFWRSVWRVMVKSFNDARSEMSRDRA